MRIWGLGLRVQAFGNNVQVLGIGYIYRGVHSVLGVLGFTG